ncbi:hypothetical protein A79_5796 [Vibrio parahaemolyticus AQ3810]|nr:hypothetical protein A79_5796 [Vibrio parahaemolyticus AQ3810]
MLPLFYKLSLSFRFFTFISDFPLTINVKCSPTTWFTVVCWKDG